MRSQCHIHACRRGLRDSCCPPSMAGPCVGSYGPTSGPWGEGKHDAKLRSGPSVAVDGVEDYVSPIAGKALVKPRA